MTGETLRNRSARLGWAVSVLLLMAGWPSPALAQTVQGHLNDAQTGFAVGGATVTLRDPSAVTVASVQANYLGAFRITVATPGTYSLLADALGYASTESDSFELKEGGVTTINLSLRAQPVELDTLDVEAESGRIVPYLKQQGFYQRKEDGFGYFITPEEIERKHPRYFRELFQSIPGVSAPGAGGAVA